MAYSPADLTAIEQAIARGERVVQFADRMVTYRSIDELLLAKADIVRALTSANRRPRQFQLVADKGFSC